MNESQFKNTKITILSMLQEHEGSLSLGKIVASRSGDWSWPSTARSAILEMIEEGAVSLNSSGIVEVTKK